MCAALGGLRRYLLGAALVVVSSVAVAAGGNTNQPLTLAQISARNVQAKHGLADAQWRLNQGTPAVIESGSGGGALVKVVQQGPGPISQVAVQSTRVLTRPAMMRAIARSLPVVGNALVIADLLETIRCQEGFGGGAECDLGQDQITVTAYRASYGNPVQYQYGSTVGEVCAALGAAYPDWYESVSAPGYTHSVAVLNNVTNSASCTLTIKHTQCPIVGGGACNVVWQGNVGFPVSQVGGVLQCPAVVIGGQSVTPSVGVDGKCPTMTYTPASENDFTDRAVQWGGGAVGTAVAGELLERGAPVDHDFPSVQPQGPPQATRETTSNPDGSVTVRDTSYPWATSPEGYGWQPRVREETYPPGATIPPLDPGGTGGTVTEGAGPEEKIITCGLPDTPPCKIDETGTPSPVAAGEYIPAENPTAPLLDIIANPSTSDPSWTWAFVLPSGCSVISAGTFGPESVSVDLCKYQPMIHDLVSMVWLITGVLGAWLMVSRTFFGGA